MPWDDRMWRQIRCRIASQRLKQEGSGRDGFPSLPDANFAEPAGGSPIPENPALAKHVWQALLTLQFSPDDPVFGGQPGAYVNVYVWARWQGEATEMMHAWATAAFRAKVVNLEHLRSDVAIELIDEGHLEQGAADYQAQAALCPLMTQEKALALLQQEQVINTTVICWARRKWWQFWRRD